MDRFISELKRFEQEGDMPRLQIVRLPNDHTSGTASNKFTPIAHVGRQRSRLRKVRRSGLAVEVLAADRDLRRRG
jgi:hypothetical protein